MDRREFAPATSGRSPRSRVIQASAVPTADGGPALRAPEQACAPAVHAAPDRPRWISRACCRFCRRPAEGASSAAPAHPGLQDCLLAGTGVEEVAAPNDFGRPGSDIVDDHGELIGEQAVGPTNDEIAAGLGEWVAQWSEYAVDQLDGWPLHAETHASGRLAGRNSAAACARINAR